MLDRMVAEPRPHELSSLIGAIYDCALDPSRWESTLDQLRQAFDGLTPLLYLKDFRDHGGLINGTVGMGRPWLEMLNEPAPEVNTRLMQHPASFPSLDEPHLMSRHIPPAYAAESPYIQK